MNTRIITSILEKYRPAPATPIPSRTIYSDSFLIDLFNRMSKGYNFSDISALGFTRFYRQQAIKRLEIAKGATVCDMMCGPGNAWDQITKKIGTSGQLVAVDFSPRMIAQARSKRSLSRSKNIELLKEDACHTSIPSNSIDNVYCGFGLKTLTAPKAAEFVGEVRRILKPGGSFVFLDLTVPRNSISKFLFLIYLKYGLPTVMKLFTRNPEAFGMLYDYVIRNDRHESIMQELVANKMNVAVDYYLCDTLAMIWGSKSGS